MSDSSTPTQPQRSKRRSLATIESSVTRLLVSTKHLLESLTQWARRESDDKFVSDAYVRLGNDFRAATRAFTNNGIDVSDIGNVPQALRVILESALSEEPSQENLDRFLPNIRNIIVSLLQNLKAKQARAKANVHDQAREIEQQNHVNPRIEIQRYPSNDSQAPSQNSPWETSTRNDALSQLQNSDALQRRASKRFSAYQYSKLVNGNNHPQISADANNVRTTVLEANNHEHRRVPSTNNSDIQEEPSSYVFLKIDNKTKKANIEFPVTFASIRLLFVDKFAYSPGLGNFPEIYIQDPITGVTYELEEHLLDEIKTGTLLCLNEQILQETDSKAISDIDGKINEFSKRIDSFSHSIIEEVKRTVSSEVKATISQIELSSNASNEDTKKSIDSNEQISKVKNELNKLRNELKSIKYTKDEGLNTLQKINETILEKEKQLQEAALEVSQDLNRAYMESCHSKLSEESDQLLTMVDDLQDVMEDMRKDVVQRGVRVEEKRLRLMFKDVEEAKKSLNEMSNYIKNEKPTWKKIWEAELDKVCEEQQFFNLQGELTADLDEDIKKIEETFQLIEQFSTEQSRNNSSIKKRNKVVQNLYIPEPGESLHDLKDAVLFDIAALQPNHASRLEAIEKAEKQRRKERELLNESKFQEELGQFVDEGKLKKSGGIAEIEKSRMQKDSENIKNGFGRI
ncbi:unnamed protein product [Candida verbasci]|uniref:Actin interacting protein 3 C-terminal domain-containing protein n=1 Tax=Candida verbasci TaxID=1227364 RepID=A0A9W4X9D8_9ASCO|nr:unnamed protein product [Candida verbasci]